MRTMRITDLLRAEGISLHASPADKNQAIDLLVTLQEKAGNLADPDQYKADILAREAQSTTAIGSGIAVPHAKSAAVKRPGWQPSPSPAGWSTTRRTGSPPPCSS